MWERLHTTGHIWEKVCQWEEHEKWERFYKLHMRKSLSMGKNETWERLHMTHLRKKLTERQGGGEQVMIMIRIHSFFD